jgi:uncharacterized protein YdhG (YjbR/CyaY superfamily)
MKRYQTVDEYIAAAPARFRWKLEEVRRSIREAAPGAKESISYGMACYSYKGRMAWFGIFTEHIGLFLRPPILQEHKAELKGYTMTKSSLHLPIDEKIPTALVKKLVRAAAKKNEGMKSA